MTNEKFTPGPWEVAGHHIEAVGDFKEKRCSGYGCNNNFVCDLDDGEYHEYWDEAECAANAALIAAAPELYECVCDALTDLEMSEGMRAHFEKVLKKARGGRNE